MSDGVYTGYLVVCCLVVYLVVSLLSIWVVRYRVGKPSATEIPEVAIKEGTALLEKEVTT
ncbi:hypothetical protein JXL21_03465 [Candidatus Bathyarchaeota archaeon]|nr:hypothetical protein [Candidatus Bathyarchaeota archaeon]